MAVFKFVINDPKVRKSYKVEVDQTKAASLVGKKIGDDFSGDVIGLNGYSLQITGGTDQDGFPMHKELKGPGKRKMLLSGPPGFHPKIKGQRKRKMVRGNTISNDVAQINAKVVKAGAQPLDKLLAAKPKEEKKEGAPAEAKPEEKKEAPKKEETPKPAEKKPPEAKQPEPKAEAPKPEAPKEEVKKEEPKPAEEKPAEAPKEPVKSGGEQGKAEN